MRLIPKANCPQILLDKKADWSQEYLDYVAGKDGVPKAAATRYGHQEVKQILVLEAYGKCGYCESAVRHVSPGTIDHILPKSERPDLVVEWSNLVLACPTCNTNKGDYYSTTDPLLNPTCDQPEVHLRWCGPYVMKKGPASKGYLTIKIVDLDRVDLVIKRKVAIDKVNLLLTEWEGATNATVKSFLADEIRDLASPSAEYTGAIQNFLVAANFPL